MKPRLILIAAMDENRLLASDHALPWRLPADVAQFRRSTLNQWLLLGRTTYEEMIGWFKPGHVPLVLSTNKELGPQDGHVVDSVNSALDLAEKAGQTELWCLGGGKTFEVALPLADELILTRVHHDFAAGNLPVYFPLYFPGDWEIASREDFAADDANSHDFSVIRLTRKDARPK